MDGFDLAYVNGVIAERDAANARADAAEQTVLRMSLYALDEPLLAEPLSDDDPAKLIADLRRQRDELRAENARLREALDWALNCVEAALDYQAQGNAQLGMDANERWFRECFAKGRAALAAAPASGERQ